MYKLDRRGKEDTRDFIKVIEIKAKSAEAYKVVIK